MDVFALAALYAAIKCHALYAIATIVSAVQNVVHSPANVAQNV
jgi:hypothetical protein